MSFVTDPSFYKLPTFMTVRELATLLRVNRNTAYEAIERGDVPGVVRVGRTIRVCRRTVIDWVKGKAPKTSHQPRGKR